MSLQGEQLRTIIKEMVLGITPPTIKGKEADEFRRDIQPDIDLVNRKGGMIVVPEEWEVNIDEEGGEKDEF